MTTMRLQVVDVDNEPLSQAVARRLRGILAEQKISASALAREMDITQATMSRKTTGVTPLTLDELSHVAEILGVSEWWLLTGQRLSPRPTDPGEGSRVYSESPANNDRYLVAA